MINEHLIKLGYTAIETKRGIVYVKKGKDYIWTFTKSQEIIQQGETNPFTGKCKFYDENREKKLSEYLEDCNK